MEREKRRFLAVDQGNTLIKLTLFEDDDPRESCRFPAEAMEDIFAVVEGWRPDCGAFCSVGKLDSRLVESLRLALDGRLLILSRSTRLPIGIDYGTPETLGFDRIALAAGASMLYGGETVAVADAGTAVTLDIVDSTGTFRGGRITAGLRLRFASLHAHTSALPLETADGPLPVAGDSTATAIRSGVVLGLADEITETFRQYREHFGCSRLVLTGGDSELLSSCIKSRIPAGHVPDLMARGLLHIYKHNEI
ncbi:MAG: type III pantothenate kinase [Muribaculaceae bacterium]|nr:type III pantothenate kinase [Muribaculaceae bacterium]